MERKWWHGKTAYQIYPKSFYDSNGDGIGDLKGIISKLDYLKELGIDIIWISPIYCSPLADQGYDISDYYNIDPRFGTMEDMDTLLAEAKKRDMYIVMDLVVNHCSDEHVWFQEACKDPDGKYGKYFYIEDRPADGSLPCNWRSYFGGPCWEELPGHPDKIYFHAFHKKQPDLNWENVEVREEIYKMVNWWLEKGVAGFRIDAIINIKKKLPYKNYPADRADGLTHMKNMLADTTGAIDFLQELADRTFRKYDAFTVGEVFNEKLSELPLFIGEQGVFSTMFDFAPVLLGSNIKGWYAHTPVTAEQYKSAIFASQKKAEGIGFLSNIIENHDEPRGVSHYLPEGECSDAAKKMLGGLNFLLQGLPFLYQGQEIGMENFHFQSIDEVDDISARNEYQVALDAGLSEQEAMAAVNLFSRDNGRCPVQWDTSANAGFTTGKPWLQVNPNYHRINLASQREDPHSVWNFYRTLTRLRHSEEYAETLVYGDTISYLPQQTNLMAYFRKGEKTLLVLGNFQSEPQTVQLPEGEKAVVLNNLPTCPALGDHIEMQGFQLLVLQLS